MAKHKRKHKRNNRKKHIIQDNRTTTRTVPPEADPTSPQQKLTVSPAGNPTLLDSIQQSVLKRKELHGVTDVNKALSMLRDNAATIDTQPIIDSLLGGKPITEIKDQAILTGIDTLRNIGKTQASYMDAMTSAFKNPGINAQIKSQLSDAYINSATGAGTSIDKGIYNRYINRPFLTVEEMTAMYVNSWVARKIVDIPVNDAMSEGIDFTHLSAEDDVTFRDRLTNLHFFEKMQQAGYLGRMSGIGMALISVKDGTRREDLNKPLQTIDKNALTGLTVVDKSYLGPVASNVSNPVNNINFLSPSNYIVWGHDIHNTRILRFDGDYLPPIQLQENGYWHASVFERIYDLLGRYDSIEAAVSLLPSEMLLKVFKAADMSAWLGGNDNTGENNLQGKIEQIIQTITTLQSVYRTVLLPADSDSSFERSELSVSGISEILMNYASLVAAAADIPHTRFLGESPAGMSTTGDGQFQDYIKMVRAMQENKLRPPYTYYFNLVAQDLWGDKARDKNLSYTFKSIYAETNNQKIDRHTKEFTIIKEAVEAGLLQPAQAVAELKAREIFPVITDKYITWVEMMDKVAEAKESGVWPDYGMFDDNFAGLNYKPAGYGAGPGETAEEINASLAEYVSSRVVN